MTSAKREVAIRATFFAWVLLSGALICGGAVKDYAHARASQSWPHVQGVVIDVVGHKISYAYSWQATTHESERVRFVTAMKMSGGPFRQGATAPGAIGLRAGEFVPVYLSPENPTLSVLEPGGDRRVFAFFLMCGAIFAFVGGGGLAVTMTSVSSEEVGLSVSAGQTQFTND